MIVTEFQRRHYCVHQHDIESENETSIDSLFTTKFAVQSSQKTDKSSKLSCTG